MNFGHSAIVWLTVLLLALAAPGPARCAMAAEQTPGRAGPVGQAVAVDTERAKLEMQKLHAEVDKLSVEIEKLRKELGVAWLAPIASVISVMSVAAILIAMWFQRRTALQIQDRAERVSFELKIADILFSSNARWIAKERLQLLRKLYKHRIDEEFANSFEKDDFPATLGQDLRMNLFQEVAGKCSTKADVMEAFSQIFPNDKWLWEKLLPRVQ